MRSPRFVHSLRTRLILYNTVVLAALFAGLGFALLAQIQASLIASVDEELRVRTQDRVNDGLIQRGAERAAARLPRDAAYIPCVIDTAGNILPRSPRPTFWDKDAYNRAMQYGDAYTTVQVEGEIIRVASRRFPANGQPQGVIQAPYRVTNIYDGIAKLRWFLLLFLLPIAFLGAGLSGAWLTNRILSSVHRIARAAKEIEARDLSRRLEIKGEDEFARLAETFNAMLDRLDVSFTEKERLVEQLKRFTANASHDLQTPLSVIKANASLVLSVEPTLEDCLVALRDIETTADSMSALVQDMLLLARADAGKLGRHRSRVSVRELVENVIARASLRPGAPVHARIGPEELTLQASKEELNRLLMNLLDNAQRYTPENGAITVSARRVGEFLFLTVSDTGVGIAPEHLAHVGERFYRVDASRARSEGGTGLGLSICRSIAEAHSGKLTIESTKNVGTTVTVSLPGCEEVLESVEEYVNIAQEPTRAPANSSGALSRPE